MDENEKKDVKKVEEVSTEKASTVNKTTAEVKSNNGNSKKVIKIASIGVIALIILALIIVGIVAIVKNSGKPSKKAAKELIESYFDAINDKDSEDLLKLIDDDGYIIYKEEKESKFDAKYKNKNSYVKKFMDSHSIDDVDELEKLINRYETSLYNPSSEEYFLKEITSIKKSEKSSKLSVIKAKVTVKDKYDDKETKTLTMYVIKVKGKFKIVSTKLS